MTCKDSAFNKRRNSRKVFVGRHNKDHLIDSRMRTKYILNFFNVFSYNINPGKIHCAFFPLKKLARVFLLKEVKPSPDRKMMKPLSFENLFPPLRYSRLNSFKERRLPLFPAIMTLVYARALLSVEIIGRLRCQYGDSNENVKKAIGLDWQINNSALHVHHAFLYISLPLMHDYDVNGQIFTFHRHREHTTTNFSFSP